ncbi:Spherulation-specific family 4 [Mycena maculata]|uniref:Spherulation-specific family 4 n=1 Tax=Mycena maculata TaxID=230809 RepID=A0AAD7K3Y6_9AGAR|nr:Spherulation-specific family 4 [Mycena maculata]
MSFEKFVSATFLLSFTFISGTQALLPSGAIVPLYIYPTDSTGGVCATWTTYLNSITDNPDLPFYLVINPDSGPGADATPSSDYTACLPTVLALGSNVKLIGYVLTGYGVGRSSTDVLADVATYLNWPVSYRPTGIFFDETAATSEFLSQYTTYVNQVRTDIPSDSTVILNPGVNVADDSYFSIADFIVTVEDFYDDFSFPGSLVVNATEPASQQAVILHDAPSTLPAALIDAMTAAGIGASFITSEPQAVAYNTTPPYWASFAAELTASQS